MMWTWTLNKQKDGQIIVGLYSWSISDHRSKKICWVFYLFASDEFDIRHRPAPLLPQQSLELKETNKMHLELKYNEPHLEKQAQQ